MATGGPGVRQYVLMATSDSSGPSPRFPLPEGANARAANADSVTPIPPPKAAIPTTRDVLIAGVVTGITAAIVCLLMRIVAWVFRADFIAYVPGLGSELTPIPWQNIVLLPLIVAFGAALLAAILLGVRYAQVIINTVGTLLYVASLAVPLWLAEDATWPTRIWLALMHTATWLIVVPQLARIVGDSDPRVTASFRDDAPADV